MKYHLTFLTGLVAVLGMFSYFMFSFNENGLFYFHRDKQDVYKVLNTFQETYRPKQEINLSAMYAEPGQLQLLHPILNVYQLQIEKARLLCGVDQGAVTISKGKDASCESASDIVVEDSLSFANWKEKTLTNYLYAHGELPENFLTKAPYVNKNGESFAYLLVSKGPSSYRDSHWIISNLAYFKLAELRELFGFYKIEDPAIKLLIGLSDSELELVVKGEPLVLTSKYLWLKDQSKFGFSPLSYWIYDVSLFNEVTKNGDYELVSATSGNYCLQRVGNACWTYNSRYALSYLYRYSVLLFAILGVAFLVFLGFLVFVDLTLGSWH